MPLRRTPRQFKHQAGTSFCTLVSVSKPSFNGSFGTCGSFASRNARLRNGRLVSASSTSTFPSASSTSNFVLVTLPSRALFIRASVISPALSSTVLKAILLSLIVLRVFPTADCVRVVITAHHFRSSIPHLFVFCAETKRATPHRNRPFLNIPICRTCGKWPEEIRRIMRLSSCFALVVLRLPDCDGIARNCKSDYLSSCFQ